MKPLISIIIPVYNAESTLRKCIDSIINQKFTDWELLLVDDGSIDQSAQICDEYADNNSRIKVIHKENGGVSSARNLGLDNSCGEFIMFVDSDDFLVNNSINKNVLDGGEDLILFSYIINSGTKKNILVSPMLPCVISTEKGIIEFYHNFTPVRDKK
ncbi:MAG: glycosyltransferase [Phocaeicola sp.]|nr:glycosyltransferase [Phocaeicola sp.]